jgi:predicted nuclease with RNAse H fold
MHCAELAELVVGVDVGGPRKGFHLVALRGRTVEVVERIPDARTVAARCRALGARVIAIDAPSRWSMDGRPRTCERELAAAGIRCFPTPTEAAARHHHTGFFDWMLNGIDLYDRLADSHPRLQSPRPTANAGVVFETFPHAIVCELSGRVIHGRDKRSTRLEILRASGVASSSLASIDEIDAALCALAARAFRDSRARFFGSSNDGFIVVPSRPCS